MTGQLSGGGPLPDSGQATDQPQSGWAAASQDVVKLVPGAEGLQYAGAGTRFWAYFVDGIILVVLTVVASVPFAAAGATSSLITYLVTIGVGAGYFLLSWTGGRRATIGQRMFQLQVGNADDGRGLTMTQAIKRWLALGYAIYFLALIPGLDRGVTGLDLIWSLVLLVTTVRSPTKQGLHDRFANTAVVRPIGATTGLGKAVVIIVVVLGVGALFAIVGLIFLGSQVSTVLQQSR